MKGNLLIVDDEVDLSVNMKELLEDEAKHIFIANNGEEGLEILRKHRIDCVVSDVKMPVMDGLKFIEMARKQGATDGFRTIINTGRVGHQEVYHLHMHVLGGPEPLGRMLSRKAGG